MPGEGAVMNSSAKVPSVRQRRKRAIGSGCEGECLFGEIGDDRVQLGVEHADAFDGRNHDLGTRKPSVENARSDFKRVLLP